MMLKRAEIGAQVFAYVITSILIVSIFLIGYKYFTATKGAQESFSSILFKNSIKNDIVKIKKDYGSLSRKEYMFPEGVQEICFVDKWGYNPLLCRGCQKSTDYLDVIDIISNNASNNVFLLDESVRSTFKVENFKIGCCTFKCFKANNGKLKITIEGDGKYATIS